MRGRLPRRGAVWYCVPFGWSGLFRSLGAQRPVARPAPGGGPAFFGRKPEERTPGRSWFFLPGPTFSGWGALRGDSFFFAWPAAHEPTPVTARPPAGRAGGGGCCSRKGTHLPPKPSPRGEGGPAKPGRMRGRSCTQPFLVEKGGSPGRRLNEVVLLPRWATRSPPHQSPSVAASPQGEASGLCSPPRKSVPNQGTQMGTVIAPRPEQCGTQRQNERVGTSGP